MSITQEEAKEYNVDFDNGKSTDDNILSLILEQLHEVYLEAKSTDELPPEIVLEFDLSKVNDSISVINSSVNIVANILLHTLGCGITYEIQTIRTSKTTMGSEESEVQIFSTNTSNYVGKVEYVISFTKLFINKYEEFLKTDLRDVEQFIQKIYN